jgi:hypothetical protein
MEATMFAKRFFYACAGVFLLALSYEVGANHASAQTGGVIEGAAIDWVTGLPAGWRCSGVEGRMFHALEPVGGRRYDPPEPIPGTAEIVATDPAGFAVMLADGSVYQYNNPGWTFEGSLLGGTTPAHSESWGEVKARYR